MDKNRYSLIVAGAGFSGVAAAVTAARQGLNVLLIEQGNCAGGAAANCLVNPFMPYWTKIDGKTQNLSAGFFTEIINELKAAKSRNVLSLIEVKCSIGARADLDRPTITTIENKENFAKYLSE